MIYTHYVNGQVNILVLFSRIILDPVAETVRVGPGNRWDAVAEALDGSGYTVVGGRIGNVGVGGYMLGGECSRRKHTRVGENE